MSLNVEGQKCPVCNGYMFNDDDVVFCPDCGAPHHRDCYNAVNHCGLEHLHGTANQYDRSKFTAKPEEPKEKITVEDLNDGTVKCRMCGSEYDTSLRNCPDCGAPNLLRLGGRYAEFDYLGGVSAKADIGEGVTADEAKMFVASNTHRYIPKFVQMAKGRKASWNLLAFFFPSAWAFSRKLYKLGFLTATVEIVCSLLMRPFMIEFNRFAQNVGQSVNPYAQILTEMSKETSGWILLAAFFAGLVSSALAVLMGIFGDKLYYKHTVSKIREIKETSDEVEDDIRSKGGVSILLFILVFVAIEYILPNFIFAFLS